MPLHKTSVHFAAAMPLNITQAANTIAAIANRDDTPCRIGDNRHSKLFTGGFVPLEPMVIAALFGSDVAYKTEEAMADPAIKDYFNKLQTRLIGVGMMLMEGPAFWMIVKFPMDKESLVRPDWLYSLGDLTKQSPNGLVLGLTPVAQGQPSPHSIQSGDQFITITVR